MIEGFTVLMLGAERWNVQRLKSRAISVSLSPRPTLWRSHTRSGQLVQGLFHTSILLRKFLQRLPLITNELADFREQQFLLPPRCTSPFARKASATATPMATTAGYHGASLDGGGGGGRFFLAACP